MSNFSIKELTYSTEAIKNNISNVPSTEELENLMFLITQLELVRTLLGNSPMNISSGYRCKALNTLVGGAYTSAHTKGLAIDFTCRNYGTTTDIVNALYNSNIHYDQLILEYPNKANGGWVHIGFSAKGQPFRRQTLITKDGTYANYRK